MTMRKKKDEKKNAAMKTKKNKVGRPKVKETRRKQFRVSIALDIIDKQRLDYNIKKSGLRRADYLREAIFDGVIREALTQEETYLIRQMYKLGQLLALLFTQGRLNKDVNAKAEFARAIAAINEISEYFLTKISRK